MAENRDTFVRDHVRPRRQTPRAKKQTVQDAPTVQFEPKPTTLQSKTVERAIKELWGMVVTQEEAVITVYDDYVVLSTDSVILVDASAKDITITLPVSSLPDPGYGRAWTVTKIDDTAHEVTLIAADGALILGEESKTICFQWTSGTFFTNGTAYTAR